MADLEIFICFLRGINVSGKNILKMDELKSLCNSLGLLEAQSYIQSGNLVFKSHLKSQEIELILKDRLNEKFKIDVPVFVYSVKSFKSIIDNNPISKMSDINIDFVHVTLLKDNIQESDLTIVTDKKLLDDIVVHQGKSIYLYLPSGYGKTKLTNTFLEQKLKTVATTRNWKTMQKMLTLSGNF